MTEHPVMEGLRIGVRESLPEISDIQDVELQDKVVEVHALALAETEFERIEDIPPSGVPGSPLMLRGTQADHYRGTARIALKMADGLEEVMGPIGIDRDILVAGGLCHDVGKAFEFSVPNRERWSSEQVHTGSPSIRHPVYGVHLALLAGLPESVVHCIGAHAMNGEGAFVTVSLETRIVQYADLAFWHALELANLLETPSGQRDLILERLAGAAAR